jgi:hypothetical protein
MFQEGKSMQTRRMVLAVAFALSVANMAWAGESPYVTAQDLDLRLFLPMPAAAGSDADKAQQAEVIAL